MIESLKAAVERAAQQPEHEQAVIASLINSALDDDARWEALFADPRTPALLKSLWAEAQEEVATGQGVVLDRDTFRV